MLFCCPQTLDLAWSQCPIESPPRVWIFSFPFHSQIIEHRSLWGKAARKVHNMQNKAFLQRYLTSSPLKVWKLSGRFWLYLGSLRQASLPDQKSLVMVMTGWYLRHCPVFFIPGTPWSITIAGGLVSMPMSIMLTPLLCSFYLSIYAAEIREFIFTRPLPTSIPGPERNASRASLANFSRQSETILWVLSENSESVVGLDACQGSNKALLFPEICELLPFLAFWSSVTI